MTGKKLKRNYTSADSCTKWRLRSIKQCVFWNMAALGLGSGVAVWYMYPTVSWLFGKMQQRLHALGVFLGAYTHKES